MPNALRNTVCSPDKHGYYGEFGGQYVPEVLVAALEALEARYLRLKNDKSFKRELNGYLQSYAGRPTPLTFARNLSRALGVTTYLKREDLLHTGAHKINNTLGQALLAQWMGKKKLVAETGAGQHGVATATVAALFKMQCIVYMGAIDVERQALNVYRMKLMGTTVRPVTSGSQTLKDATNEAIRHWITHVRDTHFIIGSVIGPHPYPMIVRDFQSVIGIETMRQLGKNKLCDLAVACVGGGSNSMGLFYPLLKTKVRLWGVEAAGKGLHTPHHSASLSRGSIGVLHGTKTYLLQDKHGQVLPTHSISAGLDYPGVGPEHSMLCDSGRVRYVSATDREALKGFEFLSREEGIIPALEPAHAIGYLLAHKAELRNIRSVVICLSGRGDKDVQQVQQHIRF